MLPDNTMDQLTSKKERKLKFEVDICNTSAQSRTVGCTGTNSAA